MAETFRDAGVGEELTQALEEMGLTRPSALQRATLPVLRRGGNLVITASSGAGVTFAYGIPLIERVAQQEGGVRALIVAPTEERTVKIAEQLAILARPLGLRVAAMAPAWSAEGAQIQVVTAGRLLPLMRASQLKLDDLKTMVVDNLSAMFSLGAAEGIETLFASAPKDTQKVLVTSVVTDAVNRLVDAHVRKALHVPPRPAVAEEVEPEPNIGAFRYSVVSRSNALQTLLLFVEDERERPTIFARNVDAAESIRSQLGLRGLAADVAVYGEESTGPGIGYGAPVDAEMLTRSLRGNDLILITPDELAHLQHIAQQAKYELKHQDLPEGRAAALERFRDALRGALKEEDIEAQLLVLAPLFDEYSAAEVAAAAVALLRKRTARAAAAAAPQEREAQEREAAEERARGTAPFVKLFLSIGSRDGIGARDIVGTITGEARVKGDQIGRVEIRDTFSIVEVDAAIADKVIRAINGTSLRGRSVRADYDRKGVGGARGGPPTRRTNRPPPRRPRPA